MMVFISRVAGYTKRAIRAVMRLPHLFLSYANILRVQWKLSAITLKGENRIKVGFFVVYDSVFPWRRVLDLMLADPCFDTTIVVIPDVSRGESNMWEVLKGSYSKLVSKYGDLVVSSWDGDSFVDFVGEFDVYALMNPYADMTFKYYQIPYLAKHGCRVVMSRYFTDNGSIYSTVFNHLSELSFLWRYYAESEDDARTVGWSRPVLRLFDRLRAVGRPKLDEFAITMPRHRERKRIIIAPHHTFGSKNGLAIGNFPEYANFFLELPQRYAQIDWVFRPHPLTFTRMIQLGYWSVKDRDDYLFALRENKNVEIQLGGGYIETFVNSDALIQDCASFLPEYYYTGKPQCFILKNPKALNGQFERWGRILMSGVYKACSATEILEFIDAVVLAGKDPMQDDRDNIFAKSLKFNYPFASNAIVEDIKISSGVCA